MSDDTRQALPDDGKGKNREVKEPVFLYCVGYDPGYPPGYRARGTIVFARWRDWLWQILVETNHSHKARTAHAKHNPPCAPGSMIVSKENPHTALLRQIINAEDAGNIAREKDLFAFVIHPAKKRNGCSINIIVDGEEISWADIERVVFGLVRFNGGDTAGLQCIWKYRDDEEAEARWKKERDEALRALRQPPPRMQEVASSEYIAQKAKTQGETPEQVREHLREAGFTEDENGTFVRPKPPFDEGERDTIALLLCAYAQRNAYTGPLYLSPHSWPELVFVMNGKRRTVRFPGERAWYGYLRDSRTIVCIPTESRHRKETYTVWTVAADPDFLEAMVMVSLDLIGPSDVVAEGLAALEQKEKEQHDKDTNGPMET